MWRSVDALVNPGNINLPILAEFEDMVLHDSGEADPMQILALGDLALVHHLRVLKYINFGYSKEGVR